MSEPAKPGKTLWEMFRERLQGGGNGHALPFYNPLRLGVGSAVAIGPANGPDFASHDFSVQEIREFTRRIGSQDFVFTDYVLRGVNTATFDNADTLTLRLRAAPNDLGRQDTLLLRLDDEFAFAEDFLAVLNDATGIFEVTDDATGDRQTYARLNETHGSYEAAVLVVSETSPDGKAAPGRIARAKLEYWDYGREVEIGVGKSAREFLFVEMNSDTGWFQIWRGREYFESPKP
jgi:hypothetical protein